MRYVRDRGMCLYNTHKHTQAPLCQSDTGIDARLTFCLPDDFSELHVGMPARSSIKYLYDTFLRFLPEIDLLNL